MFTRLTMGLVLLALFLGACGPAINPPPATVDSLTADTSPKPVELKTTDETALAATYYPAGTTNAPALVLVHMLNSNKESWQKFAAAAQQSGYAVLTIDLRGHGQSKGRGFQFNLMDDDVDAALAWLMARPELDKTRLGAVGASIGANLVLRAGSRHPEVKTLVLLSAGLDYRGLGTLEALAAYGQRSIMLVAAENDTYAATSAQTLNSQALGRHQLQIYPGSDHGTDLFAAQAGLQPMILAWLKATL